jgi:hypothetical protein
MKGAITNVIFSEHFPVKEFDYENHNTDVIVQFENGDRYSAVFFSHKSLKGLMDRDAQSDSYKAYEYYRVLNIVLVKDFNKGNLMPVIEAMITEGDFQLIFRKI